MEVHDEAQSSTMIDNSAMPNSKAEACQTIKRVAITRWVAFLYKIIALFVYYPKQKDPNVLHEKPQMYGLDPRQTAERFRAKLPNLQ